jgi:hypothetical protein
MASQKTKTVLSWIIAIFIGYICVRLFFYILGAAFMVAFTFMKFIIVVILMAVVAVPLYAIIRRMFIK